MLGSFPSLFLSSADIFQNELFQKILSETLSECQTVWIQIRPDRMSGLVLVQTVCQNYQQTTKFAAGRQRVILLFRSFYVLFVSLHFISFTNILLRKAHPMNKLLKFLMFFLFIDFLTCTFSID